MIFPLAGRRVAVAGSGGMVGGALVRRLGSQHCEVLDLKRGDGDMRRQAAVETWIKKAKPDAIFIAAATVGGILANSTRPAEFLYDNLMIASNLIEAARQQGVKKVMFLGSSCIYPRLAEQPVVEEALLTGPLEPTNQWYAVAKIAGIKLCQAFRRQYGCDFVSAMPTNLYGPNDNYDLQSSRVLPALIRKFHERKIAGAKSVTCWGSGAPLREFLHADDLAAACVFLMRRYSDEQIINVGSDSEITIKALAELVRRIVGFAGEIVWDATKPDGTPRKLMDSTRIFALGWKPAIDLETGIRAAYDDFLRNASARRGGR